MPELPEVETTRRGLLPDLAGRRIDGLVVRQRRLRYPVPRNLSGLIAGQTRTSNRAPRASAVTWTWAAGSCAKCRGT